jgi:hypothetical protein
MMVLWFRDVHGFEILGRQPSMNKRLGKGLENDENSSISRVYDWKRGTKTMRAAP